jgi:hypothetical protein
MAWLIATIRSTGKLNEKQIKKNKMETIITKESLLNFGMIETDESERIFFPMKKVLSIKSENEEYEEDEPEISIAITRMRNEEEFVLILPDGMVFINPEFIEDLEAFEKMILEYQSNN